jgi:N-sulfoglucosamine sulfohydrolase
LAQYSQSVSRLDRGIGHLMQVLREEGKYDNTLIIYISDNGAAFPEAKTTLYEAGTRLPCIMKAPTADGIPGGTDCDGLMTWADITPTILDFAGVDRDRYELHGDSVRPIAGEAHPDNWREEAFVSHSFHEITNYYPMRALRGDRYKFIWNIAHPLTYSFASDLYYSASWQGAIRDRLERFGQRTVDAYLHRPRFELYDLADDPHETVNLADRPEHAALVDSYCAKLKTWQEKTSDPWIHKWIYE